MSHNGVPDDVWNTTREIHRIANEDLDSALASLRIDFRNWKADMEPMYFGNSLVEMQEHNGGNIGPRLHAVYIAALYRLAKQEVPAHG